jgi:hypothetical protein
MAGVGGGSKRGGKRPLQVYAKGHRYGSGSNRKRGIMDATAGWTVVNLYFGEYFTEEDDEGEKMGDDQKQERLLIQRIADRVQFDVRSVQKALDNFAQFGSPADRRLGNKKAKARPRTIDPEDEKNIHTLLECYPWKKVAEFLEMINSKRQWRLGAGTAVITSDMLLRFFRDHKITRKKMQVIDARAQLAEETTFRLWLSMFTRGQCVFVDEVHKNDRHLQRRYGYSRSGVRIVVKGIYQRGIAYSMIGAVHWGGYLTAHAKKGTIKADDFQVFVNSCLSTTTSPYPGPCSVIVLDGASVHGTDAVKAAILALGLRVLPLPAYSPWLNVIEFVFSMFRLELQEPWVNTFQGTPLALLREALLRAATPHRVQGYFRYCGYA